MFVTDPFLTCLRPLFLANFKASLLISIPHISPNLFNFFIKEPVPQPASKILFPVFLGRYLFKNSITAL
ncbi:hypothetical protein A2769_03170 [Candidatus Daviesbacteria bacterium RIFCSPHIGHO2_01_FULL_37_27]|nr:MAG: hypothetical protein A2769_03170 [Candidatus Daviesbacteria bacterium RIFCSPHIGHO2_01_FULL_37_27]